MTCGPSLAQGSVRRWFVVIHDCQLNVLWHCLVALETAPHVSTLLNLYRKTTLSNNNLFALLELLKSSYVTVQPLPGLLSLQYEKCTDNSEWLRHASKFLPERGTPLPSFDGKDAITMTQKLQRPMKLFCTVSFSVAEIGFRHLSSFLTFTWNMESGMFSGCFGDSMSKLLL